MTRTQARQRKRRKRKVQKIAAWTFVWVVELLAAAAQTAVVAAIAIPVAFSQRGYFAVGGEWLLIAVAFCGAFCIIHKQVCDRIFEEGKSR